MDPMTVQEGTGDGELPFCHSLGLTGFHLHKPESWTAGKLPQHKLVNGVLVNFLSFFSSSGSQMSHITECLRHFFDVPPCEEKMLRRKIQRMMEQYKKVKKTPGKASSFLESLFSFPKERAPLNCNSTDHDSSFSLQPRQAVAQGAQQRYCPLELKAQTKELQRVNQSLRQALKRKEVPSEHERLEEVKSEASAAKRSRRHFMKQAQRKDEGLQQARGQLAKIRRFEMRYKICCILNKFLEMGVKLMPVITGSRHFVQ